jgi:phosphopantothenoylcysteine decarboxylase/phosphopantothenate--cysteine ligase
LVVGFAAETNDLAGNAMAKLKRKGCDWLLANDVSHGKVFGTDENEIVFLYKDPSGTITHTAWPRQSKSAVAAQLVATISAHFRSSP